jgi:hypothetical protein
MEKGIIMANTKITQLRNLMGPVVNYFTMLKQDGIREKTSAEQDRWIDLLENEKWTAADNISKIRGILGEIPDEACEIAMPDSSKELCRNNKYMHKHYSIYCGYDYCPICGEKIKI